MIESFLFSFFITAFLIVWFKTNVIVEYLFFLPIISKYIKEYKKASKIQNHGTFINFLSLNYNSFIVRLISCQFCITAWLALISLFWINIKFLGFIYIFALFLYNIMIYLISHNER